MEKINYDQMEALKNFYFEDSYLLDITCTNSFVSLDILAVLTPEHPSYQPPKKGEQYSYLEIGISFLNAKNVIWLKKNLKKITDADGNEDYGNIDTLYQVGDQYHIEGEWGAIEFESDAPKVS